MNRNLDNSDITTEQLWEIAALDDTNTKMIKGLHNDALIRSKLMDITAAKRYELWAAGELILNTNMEGRCMK